MTSPASREKRLAINSLESIERDGSTQWMRIRGVNLANPVLLLIQQGPGLPMINEASRFERLLHLEESFTVVYWDQRGCGRSLRGQATTAEISVDRMVGDTVALLELLRDRFSMQPLVVGFSFGATVAAMAAVRRPDLIATLVAVGTDVDGVAAGDEAYDFAVTTARERGNRRATRQLAEIGRPPHLQSKQFATRVRWASNFGGVTTNETYGSVVRGLLASLVRSPDYSLGDVVRTVRGATATQAALLSQMATLDLVHTLPRIDVPVIMVQGRLDKVAPCDPAEHYFNALQAPSKQLVWFENSAHTPQLEEPEKFRKLLMLVRSDGDETTTLNGRVRPGVKAEVAAATSSLNGSTSAEVASTLAKGPDTAGLGT